MSSRASESKGADGGYVSPQEPTREEQREYSVQRWAWMFVPQMVTLGGIVGIGLWFAIKLRWSGRFENTPAIVDFTIMLAFAAIAGAIFGIIAERMSREDRRWKNRNTK